jgi:nucleoside-diphosphate-sugar epimerase
VTAGAYEGVPVLVLGAGGFIGRWVSRALTESGASCTLVVRDDDAATPILRQYGAAGDVRRVDLGDARATSDLVRELAPAVTFNLAGYGVDPSERDPGQAARMNADLPRVLAESLASGAQSLPGWVGQRLVHAGSALEYGASEDVAEETDPLPTDLYGRTKLAGTMALDEIRRTRGLPALTARLFTVFGPGEHPGRLMPAILRAACSETVVPLTEGHQTRDFTYVEDVAAGLLRLGCVPGADTGVVNLATGRLTTVREFIETSARLLQIPPERLDFGALPTRPEEMFHAPVPVGRLERLIRWLPETDVARGIERTVVRLRQIEPA